MTRAAFRSWFSAGTRLTRCDFRFVRTPVSAQQRQQRPLTLRRQRPC